MMQILEVIKVIIQIRKGLPAVVKYFLSKY